MLTLPGSHARRRAIRMSVRVIDAVFKHSASKGAVRLVLLGLADVASDDGEVCAYARSHSVLARKANADEGTVRRAIRTLVELGEVIVIEVGDGRASSNYQIVLPGVGAEIEGVQDAPPGGARRAPRGGKSRAQGGRDAPPIIPSMSVDAPSSSSVTASPVGDARASLFADADDANARANSDGGSDVTTRASSEKRAAGPSSEAWAIAKHVHEARKPPPRNTKQTAQLAQAFMDAGRDPALVRRALVEAPTCSQGAVEVWLARNGPRPPRQTAQEDALRRETDWVDGDGRVAL